MRVFHGVKCDACPVKFEVRKHFSREGAYFTVDEGCLPDGSQEGRDDVTGRV